MPQPKEKEKEEKDGGSPRVSPWANQWRSPTEWKSKFHSISCKKGNHDGEKGKQAKVCRLYFFIFFIFPFFFAFLLLAGPWLAHRRTRLTSLSPALFLASLPSSAPSSSPSPSLRLSLFQFRPSFFPRDRVTFLTPSADPLVCPHPIHPSPSTHPSTQCSLTIGTISLTPPRLRHSHTGGPISLLHHVVHRRSQAGCPAPQPRHRFLGAQLRLGLAAGQPAPVALVHLLVLHGLGCREQRQDAGHLWQ